VTTVLRSAMLVAAATTLLLAACGSDQDSSPPGDSPSAGWSAGTVPTAEQLASVLLTVDDLEGDWTSWEGPDASPTGVPGVVPEDQRGNLPTLEFCDRASDASVRAAEQLEWTAFRQLNLTTPDAPREHQVFVQEFLAAADPAETAATYDALRDGITACAGATTEYSDGVVGTSKKLRVPALGDAAIATREIVKEPSPRGAATWDLRYVTVRDGPVLMSVQVGEVTVGDEVQTLINGPVLDDILTRIDRKLP
jgi:PknH-like protein